MGAPLRTTHADLDAVTRLTSAERTELSDIGLPPSLLIALANLIGCDVVLIAETVTEQLRRQNLEQRLTARQQEILTLVAEGCTNAQIASRLSISAGTVRKHLENAYRILGVSNRIAAISALTDAQALPVSRTRAS